MACSATVQRARMRASSSSCGAPGALPPPVAAASAPAAARPCGVTRTASRPTWHARAYMKCAAPQWWDASGRATWLSFKASMPALCQCQAGAAQLMGSDQRDISWCGQRASRAASVVEPPSPLCTRAVQASAPAAGAASAGTLRSRHTLTQSRVASDHGHACCAPMPRTHLSLLPACSLPAPPQHHAPREPVHLRRGRGARRRQRAQRGRLQGQLQARRRARLAQQEAARVPPRVGGLRSTCVLAPASGTRQRAAARARRQHTASITARQAAAVRPGGRAPHSRQLTPALVQGRGCRGGASARMAVAERMSAWGAPMPSAARTPAPPPAPRRPRRPAPGTGPAPDPPRAPWRAAPRPPAPAPGLAAPPAPPGPTGWRR